MKLNQLIKNAHRVQAIWPVDLNTAANPGDWVSLANYAGCVICISIGATSGTAAVTLDKDDNTSDDGTTTLAFDKYFDQGIKLGITGASGEFQQFVSGTNGETVTGTTSSAVGYVSVFAKSYLLLNTVSGTFQSGETITGGTTGVTATTNTAATKTDILLEVPVSGNTFTIPNVDYRTYVIPIDTDALGEGYSCMQLDIAQATGSCIGSAEYWLIEPRYSGIPMDSAI